MSEPRPLVVLTGASGLVGCAAALAFLRQGYRVRALVRSPAQFMQLMSATPAAVECVAWDLGGAVPAGAFDGKPMALVHVAYEARGSAEHRRKLNVDGTRKLVAAARQSGCYCVYVSSFAAGPAADGGLVRRSVYSQIKRETEALLDPARDLILRPALVLGPGGHALFGRVRAQLNKRVPLPLFYRGVTPIQWIHGDELAQALVRGVEKRICGVFEIGSVESVTLAQWMAAAARALGVSPRLLLIPPLLSDCFAWLLRTLESAGFSLPLGSDTVFGVKYARVVPTRETLKLFNLSVAPLDESLRRSSEEEHS